MTDRPITSEDERDWIDELPEDDVDRIDERVLSDASEADAIDQRRAAPLDEPDDVR